MNTNESYQNNIDLIKNNLRRIQEEGGDGNFVIFEANFETNIFIQFAGQKGDSTLTGEAVENEYLEDEYKLAPAQIKRLEYLGWQYHEHTGMNHSQSWQASTDLDREYIAKVVLQTLKEAYNIDPSHPLAANLNLE